MPYAPGIQDISGELLAQGMREKARGIAGGAVNWLQGYEQNQQLKNQSLAAFSGLLGSDPDFQAYVNNVASGGVQVPDAVKKAIKNYQGGNIDVYDAAILGNTGQMFAKHKGDAITRAHMTAMTNLATQQTELEKAKVAEAQRQADFWKNLGESEDTTKQAPPPPPAGGVAPAAPSAQPSYGVSTPSPNAAVPAMLSRFAEQQPPPGAQAAVAMLGAPAATAVSERPSGVATRQDMREAARRLGAGATEKDVVRGAQQIAQDRLKAYMGESVFTGPSGQDQAAAKADALNAQGRAPSGMVWAAEYDGASKGWYPKLREAVKGGAQLAKEKELTVTSEEESKAAVANNQRRASQGADANNESATSQKVVDLLNSGVLTGPIESAKLKIKEALAGTPFLTQEQIDSANSPETLRTLLLDSQLAKARTYSSRPSNFEERLVGNAVANFDNKLAGSNLYLAHVTNALNMKRMDAIAEQQKLEDADKTQVQIDRAMSRWESNPKNSLLNYIAKSQQSSKPTKVTEPAAGGIPTINSQAEYDALPPGSPYIDSTGKQAFKRGK